MSETYYKDPYSCGTNAGRWNPKGSRMIYAASSSSLSLLEYLCIKGSFVAKRQWHMHVFDIENSALIGEIDPSDLPADWNALPHVRSTQEFGKMWLTENEFPFLKVPSARNNLAFYPDEHNLLINPDFPDLREQLKIIETIPINYLLDSA